MKLSIDRNLCITCGQCYLKYLRLFDCDDEGLAVVKESATCQDHIAGQRAIYLCPTRAINQTADQTDLDYD